MSTPLTSSSKKVQDPKGRYVKLDEVLGIGSFKQVYKALDVEEGIEVAWNQIRLDRYTDEERASIVREIRLLQQLDHENILTFYGSWYDEEKNVCVFITEIMAGGTLNSYIEKKNHSIKLKVIKKWCRQILSGLKYLHGLNPPVVHRDLKSENIFINGSSGDIKIGDLGLSSEMRESRAQSVIGTPEFMAPELLDESYTSKVDIYAFGMVLLEITTHEYPYMECANYAQIFKKVMSGEKPRSLYAVKNREVRTFIEICLDDQQQRLSAVEMLSHPFFDDMACTDIVELYNDEEVDAIIARELEKENSNNQQTLAPDDADIAGRVVRQHRQHMIERARANSINEESGKRTNDQQDTKPNPVEPMSVALSSVSEDEEPDDESNGRDSELEVMRRQSYVILQDDEGETFMEVVTTEVERDPTDPASSPVAELKTAEAIAGFRVKLNVFDQEDEQEDDDGHALTLEFGMKPEGDTNWDQFTFQYLVDQDTPADLARELASEFDLPNDAEDLIETVITHGTNLALEDNLEQYENLPEYQSPTTTNNTTVVPPTTSQEPENGNASPPTETSPSSPTETVPKEQQQPAVESTSPQSHSSDESSKHQHRPALTVETTSNTTVQNTNDESDSSSSPASLLPTRQNSIDSSPLESHHSFNHPSTPLGTGPTGPVYPESELLRSKSEADILSGRKSPRPSPEPQRPVLPEFHEHAVDEFIELQDPNEVSDAKYLGMTPVSVTLQSRGGGITTTDMFDFESRKSKAFLERQLKEGAISKEDFDKQIVDLKTLFSDLKSQRESFEKEQMAKMRSRFAEINQHPKGGQGGHQGTHQGQGGHQGTHQGQGGVQNTRVQQPSNGGQVQPKAQSGTQGTWAQQASNGQQGGQVQPKAQSGTQNNWQPQQSNPQNTNTNNNWMANASNQPVTGSTGGVVNQTPNDTTGAKKPNKKVNPFLDDDK